MHPKVRRRQHRNAAKSGSSLPFHAAIRKYGIDKMEYKELISISASTLEDLKKCLDTLEKLFISIYKEKKIALYNCNEGGETVYNRSGERLTAEHKHKISDGIKRWHASLLDSKRESIGQAISKGRKRPILQFSLDGTLLNEWTSASDVPFAKQNAISNCLRGKSKTCAGFIWKYKDE